jgi:prepilin-type N-terminal cleavage/methylation domain-containing protein
MSPLTSAVARVRARVEAGERGFTLIEMLVATTIFMILTGALFGAVMATSRGVKSSREYNDLNEEARVLLNRMSRELREAKRITAAANPAGTTWSSTADSSVTFDVDFNGNNNIEPTAADPERLTYTYDRANSRVTLQAAGENYPILAANVSAFKLTFNSRLYTLDAAPKDGIVTWQELDADTSGAYGNNNNTLDQELEYIDSITIEFTVLTGVRRQDYRTQVDLRNRPY